VNGFVKRTQLSNGAISHSFNKDGSLTLALHLKLEILAQAQSTCQRVVQNQYLPQRFFDHSDRIVSCFLRLVLSRMEEENIVHWERQQLIQVGKEVDLFLGSLSWADKNGVIPLHFQLELSIAHEIIIPLL